MRILSLLLLLIFSIPCWSNKEKENSLRPKIVDISYDYTIADNLSYKPDCIGTLKFTVIIPKGTNRVVYLRSRDRLLDYTSQRFIVKGFHNVEDNDTSITITKENFTWGTFFAVYATVEGHNHYSDTIDINSYIAPEGLDKVINRAAMEDIGADFVKISSDSNTLIIDTEHTLFINILNVNGSCIFSGTIKDHFEIPTTTPLLIVQYQIGETLRTKKIIIK